MLRNVLNKTISWTSGKNYCKKGSISIFAIQILASFTAFSIILFNVSKISLDENRLLLALDRNSEVVLANYNQELYDRFGLMAFEEPESPGSKLLTSIKDIKGISDPNEICTKTLEKRLLYKEIERFSRLRFPLHAGLSLMDFLVNLRSADDEMEEMIKKKKTDNKENDSLADDDEESNNQEAWTGSVNQVLDLLKNQLQKEEEEDHEAAGSEEEVSLGRTIGNDLKDLILDQGESFLEGDILVKAFGAHDSIHGILGQASEIINRFYVKESGEFYKRLAFEYYCSEMFSCHVNFSKEGAEGREKPFKNLRGIAVDRYSPVNSHEIERIVYGNQVYEKNYNYTFASIFAIRLAINIFSNYYDENKNLKVQAMAALISLGISLISLGHLNIPPEILETGVILLLSAYESYRDWSKLTQGERLYLLPTYEKEFLKLTYKDYLRVFLLLVPLDKKLERVDEILRENVCEGKELFTEICSQITYRGKVRESRKSYFY